MLRGATVKQSVALLFRKMKQFKQEVGLLHLLPREVTLVIEDGELKLVWKQHVVCHVSRPSHGKNL